MSGAGGSVYPQAKPLLPEEVAPFLEQSLIAKLCTHNEDGSIHVVPIWFRYQGEAFLFGTQKVTQKVQNIQRNPLVSVLVDTTEPALQGVIVKGTASLVTEDVIPTRISIFEKYVGADEAPALANRLAGTWDPVIIRVEPVEMITFDYTKGFGLEWGMRQDQA